VVLPSSRSLEVLLLADEPTRSRVCAALALVPSRVSVVQTGAALMARVWERVPDLIIVGAALERDAVAAVCRSVRQFLQTPILVVEAGASADERIGWLDGGADDVLALLASSPAELVARCHALLRRQQRQQRRDPAALRLQALNMQLDLVERRLHLPEKQVLDLSAAQVWLLALFFSYGERIVPHAALAQHVVLPASRVPPSSRRATHLILKMNQRFAQLPHAAPRIEHVRGVGYRLALVGRQQTGRAYSE
jgi:two-component system, OmpR family, KDP operon response regulator KdpE